MDKNIRIIDIEPEISVLMPVYNGDKYLKESIDSILSQTFTNFELIIVNDGSKDNSLEILKSYSDPRIIIIDNKVNKGLIESLNIGLSKCRGKYTARMDQDDISLPDRLQIQFDFMEKNKEIDLVGGWTECINKNGDYIKTSRSPENPWIIRYELIFNNVMFHSSIFFKTDIVIKNGGYDKKATHSEDYDMYSRPNKELMCSNIQRVLFKYRIHNESITGSTNTQQIVHENALNVAFRNINKYIIMDRNTFDYLKDVLIIKTPSDKITIDILIKSIKILKKITENFIKINNLDKNNRKNIIDKYKGKRNSFIKNYFIGKYHKIIKWV
jgi:glycosyltransferase involved in cell wall biosynthesis